MNIYEAAEAARSGKRVELNGYEAVWNRYAGFAWKGTGDSVKIGDSALSNDWRIIPEPNLYQFSEAFKKMESGIWMKSCMTSYRYRRNPGGSWAALSSTGMSHTPSFSPHEVAGEWFEYTD